MFEKKNRCTGLPTAIPGKGKGELDRTAGAVIGHGALRVATPVNNNLTTERRQASSPRDTYTHVTRGLRLKFAL